MSNKRKSEAVKEEVACACGVEKPSGELACVCPGCRSVVCAGAKRKVNGDNDDDGSITCKGCKRWFCARCRKEDEEYGVNECEEEECRTWCCAGCNNDVENPVLYECKYCERTLCFGHYRDACVAPDCTKFPHAHDDEDSDDEETEGVAGCSRCIDSSGHCQLCAGNDDDSSEDDDDDEDGEEDEEDNEEDEEDNEEDE